jgi:hypothetical protein
LKDREKMEIYTTTLMETPPDPNQLNLLFN